MTDTALSALLRAVPVALLVVDPEARILGANEPAEALLGPVPGTRPIVTVLRHPEVNAALDAVLAGQDRARLNVTLKLADHRVLCEVTVTRLDAPGLQGAAISIETQVPNGLRIDAAQQRGCMCRHQSLRVAPLAKHLQCMNDAAQIMRR